MMSVVAATNGRRFELYQGEYGDTAFDLKPVLTVLGIPAEATPKSQSLNVPPKGPCTGGAFHHSSPAGAVSVMMDVGVLCSIAVFAAESTNPPASSLKCPAYLGDPAGLEYSQWSGRFQRPDTLRIALVAPSHLISPGAEMVFLIPLAFSLEMTVENRSCGLSAMTQSSCRATSTSTTPLV